MCTTTRTETRHALLKIKVTCDDAMVRTKAKKKRDEHVSLRFQKTDKTL